METASDITPPGASVAISERDVVRRGGSLHVRVARAPGDDVARLAILPGYGDHGGRYVEFMRWMAGHGVSSYALDFRGHGRSAGRRGYVRHWDDYLEDLQLFLGNVSRDATSRRKAPTFLLGHSHGALVAAAAAVRSKLPMYIDGLILVSPFLQSLVEVPTLKQIAASAANLVVPWFKFKSGLEPEMMTGDPGMIDESRKDPLLLRCATPRWYFGMLEAQHDTKVRAKSLTFPLYMLVGDKDTVADPKTAVTFYKATGSEERNFTVIEGRKHELLRETDRVATFGRVYDWIRARLHV